LTKNEFISALTKKLSGLPASEVEERIAFYVEMIDDAMEEGQGEEEAVASLGDVEDVAEQVLSSVPLRKIAAEKLKPNRRLKAWEITLIALGSPIWLTLIITAFAVIFSLYAVLWSVIIAFWSVFVSVAASGFGLTIAGIMIAITENGQIGLALLGAGIICIGVGILLFFACKIVTFGALYVTKKLPLWIKMLFVKED